MERYYEVAPEQKTLEQCYQHGADHRSYHWVDQIDPRWSQEQKEAYLKGFNGEGR